MKEQMTPEEIREQIKINDSACDDAFANLRLLLLKDGPREAEYYRNLVRACNLCSYTCRERAKLEFELMEALRDGR